MKEKEQWKRVQKFNIEIMKFLQGIIKFLATNETLKFVKLSFEVP